MDPLYRVSGASPFGPNCDGEPITGTLYVDAEVEPSLAIDPRNPMAMAAVWQQDRWSNGGARGIVAAVSPDGGHTWAQHPISLTRCAGGTSANGGDYPRASNPWITVAPDGTLNQLALGFDGGALTPGSVSAVLTSSSVDGGFSWGPTKTLIRDSGGQFFNDKGAITADPVTPQYVYAVWDRLSATTGPTVFTRSSDGGQTWATVRAIFDPGPNNQTISNAIVVLPDGRLVDFLLEIDGTNAGQFHSYLEVIRSDDQGTTWSAPVRIAENLSVGTRDPDTGAPVRDSSLVPEIAAGPGGELYVVWQDSRFTAGARDAIALSFSTDGGSSWSAPLRINADLSTPAFSPQVHVRVDGMVAVSYYDFRDDTGDPVTLYTGYWLTRSLDLSSWQENRIAGPFDLALAPNTTSPGAGGYFLGDYQALASVGTTFMPMFVQTATTTDPTDVFFAPQVSAMAAIQGATHVIAQSASAYSVDDAVRARASDNIVRAMRARIPNWREHP